MVMMMEHVTHVTVCDGSWHLIADHGHGCTAVVLLLITVMVDHVGLSMEVPPNHPTLIHRGNQPAMGTNIYGQTHVDG